MSGTIVDEYGVDIIKISEILKSIAHPIRLGVVKLLEDNEFLSVTEIIDSLKTEQSLTSHHLSKMKESGVLSVKREGRKMLYSLKQKEVISLLYCLNNCKIK